MLETVSRGFKAAKAKLQGRKEITAEVVDDALRDIRVSLLEADVAFDVVKRFVARVREKAVGEVVETKVETKKGLVRVTPQDHFVKICHDELEALMGPVDTSLKVKERGATGVMMVGLQGSGKTTTAGKLANRFLKEGKKPLLVAADVYRPAAVDQLQVLGQQLQVPVFHEAGVQPPELCRRALEEAARQKRDVVIYDTARRLAIDGFILTKLDGDARGGAALSIKEVTGKPIKFLGMGESLDRLEEFRPEGLAGRILGFGDIVGLMKDFEEVVDEKRAEADAEKPLSRRFDMRDFVDQIRMVRRMGPLKDLLEKFPLFGELTDQLNPDEKELDKIEAIFNSMTEKERRNPALIEASRAERIARGSGRKKEDVRDLLNKFSMMQQVMGTLGQNPGLLGRIPGFRQIAQLQRMKGMDLSGVFGKDAKMMEQAMGMGAPMPMQMPQVAPGYTPPVGQAQMAKARLMGDSTAPQGKSMTDREREAIKERRKRERQNKKKNRKRR